MIGRPLAVALSGTTAEEREAYGRQLLGGEISEIETRQLRRDGTPIDIWVTSAPIRGDDGAVIGASLVIRDVSAHRKREDHVRFLMRELTHRSKNLLAVIQAMARQSMAKDLPPEEFVRRFTDRLQGLAGSHDLLSAVEYKGASLLALIRSQLSHYEDLFGTRILLEGEDLTVRAEAAQNIGVALHELSTNAAKYGALSNDAGTVTVAWEIVGDDAAHPAPGLAGARRAAGGGPDPPRLRPRGHGPDHRAGARRQVGDLLRAGAAWCGRWWRRRGRRWWSRRDEGVRSRARCRRQRSTRGREHHHSTAVLASGAKRPRGDQAVFSKPLGCFASGSQ